MNSKTQQLFIKGFVGLLIIVLLWGIGLLVYLGATHLLAIIGQLTSLEIGKNFYQTNLGYVGHIFLWIFLWAAAYFLYWISKRVYNWLTTFMREEKERAYKRRNYR